VICRDNTSKIENDTQTQHMLQSIGFGRLDNRTHQRLQAPTSPRSVQLKATVISGHRSSEPLTSHARLATIHLGDQLGSRAVVTAGRSSRDAAGLQDNYARNDSCVPTKDRKNNGPESVNGSLGLGDA
jgi:hypothetical protein